MVVGDKVLLDGRNLNLKVPTRKLSDRNFGPFKIVKQHGPVNYELQLPESWKIHPVFHSGLLIPYKEGDYPGRQKINRPDPEVIDGEEEYEVEYIVDYNPQKKQYLVHWKGYPVTERTYLPLTQLNNASELVRDYHVNNPNAAKPKNLMGWLKRNLIIDDQL